MITVKIEYDIDFEFWGDEKRLLALSDEQLRYLLMSRTDKFLFDADWTFNRSSHTENVNGRPHWNNRG